MLDAYPEDVKEISQGWVTFEGKHGYDYQKEEALNLLEVGKQYRVVRCDVSRSSSTYKLEGFDKKFNTVLFAGNFQRLPFALIRQDY